MSTWEEPVVCQCGHLTDERMAYAPDAKIARETPGPHHTPIRCRLFAKTTPVADASAESVFGGVVYAVHGDKL